MRRRELVETTAGPYMALVAVFSAGETTEVQGQAIRYMDVTPADIAVANQLAAQPLGQLLDDLG